MRQARNMLIATIIAGLAFFWGCSGPQPVKQYEIGKVAAETLLYEARVAQNKGQITASQFDQVRKVYDQLKQAQDIAIDARRAMIAAEQTPEVQKRAQEAMDSVFRLSAQLVKLAQDVGLMKGGI